jgi:hypothetical protein
MGITMRPHMGCVNYDGSTADSGQKYDSKSQALGVRDHTYPDWTRWWQPINVSKFQLPFGHVPVLCCSQDFPALTGNTECRCAHT